MAVALGLAPPDRDSRDKPGTVFAFDHELPTGNFFAGALVHILNYGRARRISRKGRPRADSIHDGAVPT